MQPEDDAALSSSEDPPVPVSELHIQVQHGGYIAGAFARGAVVSVRNNCSARAGNSRFEGQMQPLAFGVLNASDCLPSEENVVMFVHRGYGISIDDRAECNDNRPAVFSACLPNGDPRAVTQAWKVEYDVDFRHVFLRSVARYDCWLSLRSVSTSTTGTDTSGVLVLSNKEKRSKFQLFAIG